MVRFGLDQLSRSQRSGYRDRARSARAGLDQRLAAQVGLELQRPTPEARGDAGRLRPRPRPGGRTDRAPRRPGEARHEHRPAPRPGGRPAGSSTAASPHRNRIGGQRPGDPSGFEGLPGRTRSLGMDFGPPRTRASLSRPLRNRSLDRWAGVDRPTISAPGPGLRIPSASPGSSRILAFARASALRVESRIVETHARGSTAERSSTSFGRRTARQNGPSGRDPAKIKATRPREPDIGRGRAANEQEVDPASPIHHAFQAFAGRHVVNPKRLAQGDWSRVRFGTAASIWVRSVKGPGGRARSRGGRRPTRSRRKPGSHVRERTAASPKRTQ